MRRKHNKAIVPNAKELRKHMTREEAHLRYDFLRGHLTRFSRQKVLGHYIADFYSAEAKLVIELDGSQHYEKDMLQKDRERTAFLEGYELKILRFTNRDVQQNFEGVCQWINDAVKQRLNRK